MSCVSINAKWNVNVGTKKNALDTPLNYLILAVFPPWGGSKGAGRLTRCKDNVFRIKRPNFLQNKFYKKITPPQYASSFYNINTYLKFYNKLISNILKSSPSGIISVELLKIFLPISYYRIINITCFYADKIKIWHIARKTHFQYLRNSHERISR